MKVVYVYIGASKVPRYVLENLSNTKSKFPNIDIVFISDNALTLKKVSDLGIKVWRCKNQSDENSEALNSMAHPMDFRSGFWFSTLARFFAIEEFMVSNSETEVLQIEADVWLSKNFPFEKFLHYSKGLSYPIESVRRGAASILYVGSIEAVKNFNSYCRDRLKEFPNSTDMTLLGEYLESYPNRVIPLPSAPDGSSFKDFTPKDLALKASSGCLHFGGVFDPLSYGMHLFGIDAKNHRGLLKLYTDTPIHILDIRKMEFEIISGEIIAKNDLHSFHVHNLHIHSKNLKIFKNVSSESEMHRLVSMRRNHEITRISWSVLAGAIYTKIKKWFKRVS
jgi:hypothetical protein